MFLGDQLKIWTWFVRIFIVKNKDFNAYYVPISFLNVLCILAALIFTTNLWCRYYNYIDSPDEEINILRSWVTCQGHLACRGGDKKWSQEWYDSWVFF